MSKPFSSHTDPGIPIPAPDLSGMWDDIKSTYFAAPRKLAKTGASALSSLRQGRFPSTQEGDLPDAMDWAMLPLDMLDIVDIMGITAAGTMTLRGLAKSNKGFLSQIASKVLARNSAAGDLPWKTILEPFNKAMKGQPMGKAEEVLDNVVKEVSGQLPPTIKAAEDMSPALTKPAEIKSDPTQISSVKDLITTQKRITVDDLRKNPDTYYLFGDNLKGYGKGGQAIIRDEPNAIGIPTKKKPTWDDDAFFSDSEFEANKSVIDKALSRVPEGSKIVIPEDGLGVGRAKLPDKAPRTYSYLQDKIKELSSTKDLTKLDPTPTNVTNEILPSKGSTEIIHKPFRSNDIEGVLDTHRGPGNKHLRNSNPGEPGWLGNPYLVKSAGGQYTVEDSVAKYKTDLQNKYDSDPVFRDALDQAIQRGDKLGYYNPQLKGNHAEALRDFMNSKRSAQPSTPSPQEKPQPKPRSIMLTGATRSHGFTDLTPQDISKIKDLPRDSHILIGDEPSGADRAFQELLKQEGFTNVTVHHAGTSPRFNAGFQSKRVQPKAGQSFLDAQRGKDKVMLEEADEVIGSTQLGPSSKRYVAETKQSQPKPESIVYEPTGRKHSSGKTIAATRASDGTITIDPVQAKLDFQNKAWLNPQVAGVDPLPDIFKTVDDWQNFLVAHERFHSTHPNPTGDPAVENLVNRLAIEQVEKLGKSQTPESTLTSLSPEKREAIESLLRQGEGRSSPTDALSYTDSDLTPEAAQTLLETTPPGTKRHVPVDQKIDHATRQEMLESLMSEGISTPSDGNISREILASMDPDIQKKFLESTGLTPEDIPNMDPSHLDELVALFDAARAEGLPGGDLKILTAISPNKVRTSEVTSDYMTRWRAAHEKVKATYTARLNEASKRLGVPAHQLPEHEVRRAKGFTVFMGKTKAGKNVKVPFSEIQDFKGQFIPYKLKHITEGRQVDTTPLPIPESRSMVYGDQSPMLSKTEAYHENVEAPYAVKGLDDAVQRSFSQRQTQLNNLNLDLEDIFGLPHYTKPPNPSTHTDPAHHPSAFRRAHWPTQTVWKRAAQYPLPGMEGVAPRIPAGSWVRDPNFPTK